MESGRVFRGQNSLKRFFFCLQSAQTQYLDDDELPTSVEVVRAGTGDAAAKVMSLDNSTGVNGGDMGKT